MLGLLNQDYLTGNNQQLAALGLLPSYDQQMAKNLGYGMSAGDLVQQDQQAMINAAMQGYNENIYNPLNLISAFGNVGTQMGNVGGTATSQQPYYQPSIASQLMGGAGNAAGLYGILKGVGLLGLA